MNAATLPRPPHCQPSTLPPLPLLTLACMQADEAEGVTQNEVVTWFAANLHPECEHRRKLRTWVVGKGVPPASGAPLADVRDPAANAIDDFTAFHASANQLPPKFDPMANVL